MINIGISMRLSSANGYEERRDSIARDWPKYFQKEFNECNFLFLPNIENKIVEYLNNWSINVIILSGGEDIEVYPERDNTEISIIKYGLDNKIPIIGICRGMQLINSFYGGRTISNDLEFSKKHTSTHHLIEFKSKFFEVNSFHKNRIDENFLNKSLEVYARCNEDKSIEGFRNKDVLCMMWHPERELDYKTWNTKLIKEFIYQK